MRLDVPGGGTSALTSSTTRNRYSNEVAAKAVVMTRRMNVCSRQCLRRRAAVTGRDRTDHRPSELLLPRETR